MGKDFRVAAGSVARAITRNTVLVVASSPCFPHGVIDDVEGIARVSLPPLHPSCLYRLKPNHLHLHGMGDCLSHVC